MFNNSGFIIAGDRTEQLIFLIEGHPIIYDINEDM